MKEQIIDSLKFKNKYLKHMQQGGQHFNIHTK